MKVVTDAGETIDLGDTEATPTIGITDYSRRVTDDFGVTTVVPRGFSRTLSVRLGVPFDGVDALQQRLAALRATSALWLADDRYASLSVRGFYKDFDIDLAFPPLSTCTLTVEGLAETSTAPDPGGDPAPEGQASTLQLLQPLDVSAGVLAASNVPETDAPEWVASATYAKAARVIKTATHRLYESIADGNLGNDPAGTSGQWLDLGPTNRWSMFDQALGTATTINDVMIITLDAPTASAMALLDVTASIVRVQRTGYDRTVAVGTGAITFLDLPAGTDKITVTIRGAGAVSVGTLLIGEIVSLGVTEASPTAGITDFSRKQVDDFGAVTIVERAWAKRMTAKALIRTDAIDAVFDRIASVRAVPSLWLGQAGVDSLTVYGFFKDFSIEVDQEVSKLSLSIEGLSRAAKLAPLLATVGWPDVTDPLGTKPADNADVTGDNTSKDTANVAGRPSDQVIVSLDSLSQTTKDLVETYGDTVTSAAARDAASAAAKASQAAQVGSETAYQQAEAAYQAAAAAAQTAANAGAGAAAAQNASESAFAQAEAASAQAAAANTAAGSARDAARAAADASAQTATSAAGSASSANGSATSAAQSATDAGTSASAAQAAYLGAKAQGADAAKSAGASASSATAAAASQSAAGQSASVAQQSALNAATQAGQASSSASQSAASASDAAGSRNSASTYAQQAASSRDAAGLSADAAAQQASSASSSAGAAGRSATAAQASGVVATLGAAQVFPSTFVAGGPWASTWVSSPQTLATSSLYPATFFLHGKFDTAPNYAANIGPTALSPVGVIAPINGRTYEIEVKVRGSAADQNGAPICINQVDFIGLDENYAEIVSGFSGIAPAPDAPNGVNDGSMFADRILKLRYTAGADHPAFVRPRWKGNFNGGSGPVPRMAYQLSYFRTSDITDVLAGQNSAAAAATSASSAGVAQDSAGQSARSASTSATNAATSAQVAGARATDASGYAGQASTSASQASQSATNANGSANTASQQAGVATTAQQNASGYASSAAGSASNASSSANEAANQASAAQAQAISAASSAKGAGLSAQAAASSASGAASYADQSSQYASAAQKSSVSSTIAGAQLFPSTFTSKAPFSSFWSGSPAANAVRLLDERFYSNGNYDSNWSYYGGGGFLSVAPVGVIVPVAGRTYEIEVLVYDFAPDKTGATVCISQLDFICMDASYNEVDPASFVGFTTAPGFAREIRSLGNPTFPATVLKYRYTPAANHPACVRPRWIGNWNGGGSGNPNMQYGLAYFRTSDITDILAGQAAAASASQSASAASGYSTAAGQYASAALGSATNAAASEKRATDQAANALAYAGNAATSAGQASTSAANAGGSSNSASSFASQAAGSRDTAGGYAGSAASSASSALSSSNSAGSSASSASDSANRAAGSSSNAQTAAQSASSSSAVAGAAAAAAQQSSIISASVAAASLSANPVFADFNDPNGVPGSWSSWGADYSSFLHNRSTPGRFGPYAYQQSTGDGKGNVRNNVGLQQTYNTVAGLRASGPIWMVLEATVTLVDGVLNGSGLYVQSYAGSTYIGAGRINFFTDAPIGQNAAGAGIAGNTYSFSKLVNFDSADGLQFYLMTHWDSFDSGTFYKTLQWHKASLRLASAAEIAGNRADANANSALAQVSSLTTTTAAADKALSDRLDTLGTQVLNNASAVTNLQQSVANNYSAAAQQISTVKAFAATNSNLVRDVGSWTRGGTGLNYTATSTWGPYLLGYPVQNGGYRMEASAPRIGCDGNRNYTVSCDLLATPNGGDANQSCYVQVRQYDGAGKYISDLCYTPLCTNASFDDGNYDRKKWWATGTTNGNARSLEVEFWSYTTNSNTPLIGIRKVKLEQGSLPTAYTNETEQSASVQVMQAATSDLARRINTAVFEVKVKAGTSEALLSATADGYGRSAINFVAGSFHIWSQDGANAIEALSIDSSGKVTIPNLAVEAIEYKNIRYGGTGECSLYFSDQDNDNNQTAWTALMGIGITPAVGAPVVGQYTFFCRNLGTGTINVPFRVVRVTDGTVVAGTANGRAVDVTAGGVSISGQFADSVSAGTFAQYEVQVRVTSGQSVRQSMRTMMVRELLRDHFSQIYIKANPGEGPGAGNAGGGSVNGSGNGGGTTNASTANPNQSTARPGLNKFSADVN